MNNKKECICTKLCKKLYCRFNIRKKVIDTTASLPKDISDTLSDVNLSIETQGKIVNQINDDYKKDYGTSISIKDKKSVKDEKPVKDAKPVKDEKTIIDEEEKHVSRPKIKLAIDNDYIRKSSDNLGEINSPRTSVL